MASSGVSTITLTAIALNSSRQAVSGRTITFSPGTDASAYINNISNGGMTDANGQVTAQLNLGASKANRTISVTATVDGVTATNTVSVTGTTISFSGNSSMSFGQTNPLTISLKDSAGNPISSVPVTVTSQTGNTIVLNPVTGMTDANGLLTANVTVTQSGNDVITASAAGATKTQNLTINSATFNFSAPTAAAGSAVPQIQVNTATPISVTWANAGTPVSGSAVTFTSTRGTITSSPATTNASGVATASITSSQSGPAIITATGPGGTPSASIQVNFYTTSASMLSLQASPSTLQPTTGATGQTNNLSTITAVVRDAAYNLVQNAQVNFAIVSDPSGGSLDAQTSTTDSYGTATIHYKAGAVTSPQNGVIISATVVAVAGTSLGTPLAATPTPNVSLTVGGAALYVTLGTDNTVGTSGTNYTKTYTALVTDS
ncbi:MAG: hypothetical protein HKL98_10230, partial [Burkholderiales bacterium]|nr:hypothetical protein [Burkholderiales bacterium]